MSKDSTENFSTDAPKDTLGHRDDHTRLDELEAKLDAVTHHMEQRLSEDAHRAEHRLREDASRAGERLEAGAEEAFWEPPMPQTGLCGLSGFLSSPEIRKISKSWWPFMLLGITLLVLGFLSIGASFFVTILTVAVLGVLLMIGGVMQVVNAFYAGRWSGFLLQIALGLLYAVVGFMLLDAPLVNAITLTFLLSAFFMVAGLFRMIASLSVRMPGWGWTLFSGVITFLLGVLIYKQWPSSGLWVIGLFVGIEMIFSGWYWIMFASGLRAWNQYQAQNQSSPVPQGP